MKQIVIHFAAMVLTTLLLAACGGSTQGPATWIDRPLDGAHVPLASLTILAHASDADGVATIEFYISESLLAAIPAGSGRLGEASIEWMPPQAGEYTIVARAIDSGGNAGPKTFSKIIVGETAQPTDTPTPAPASSQCAAEGLAAPILVSPADGSTVEPEPLLTWSYPDDTCHPHSYRIDISEDAAFSDISLGFGTLDYNETSRQWSLPPGKCYYWRALAYVPDVNGPASPAWHFCIAETTGPSFTLTQNANCRDGPGTAYEVNETLFQGQTVAIEGRNEESNWFWVRKPGGSAHCWVSVITGRVVGDLNAVQIVSAPSPPEPPADTTPPEIGDLFTDPTSIQVAGCGEPSATVVSATVSDEGGVNRVVARILGYGEVEMTEVGGNIYQATLGPFSDVGELPILIQAWDNAGNNAQAGPITITLVCIG